MDWVVVIRTLNGLGCACALTFLIYAAHQQWKTWNFKTQQHWWALVGWTSLGMESTIESYFINIQPGPRTVLTTLVVAWTVRAILVHDEVRARPALPRKDSK